MSEKKTLTRSEIVRQRRLEQLRKNQQEERQEEQKMQESQVIEQRSTRTSRPVKKRKPKQSSYRELPPITARGVVNDFAIERHKNLKNRRFNAVFALPRPKIRAISLPRIHLRVSWRVLSFFLVLLFGTALYLFWTMPQFRVSSVQVTGNRGFTSEEISSVLGLEGFPVFLLTPNQIKEQVLRNYPELASVEVTVSIPNTVIVHLTERQPVILWQQDGGFTWVDETGTAFRPRGDAQGLVVVQALGSPPAMAMQEDDPLTPVPFISEDMVEAILILTPHVPAGTPLLYDPVTGFGFADLRGWQVIFGTGADKMEVKIQIYHALVDWLSQRGIQPILINVAYPTAPFYRLEQIEIQVEEQ